MHGFKLIPLVVLVAGCAARRPAPPLAGPSSAPVYVPPAAAALLAPPTEAAWAALGDEATALLSQYLRINTTNPPGNEIVAARWLAQVLRRDGIEARIFEPAPGKANLYARLAGDGSSRPIILLNHMDVVLASPDYWSVDPFSGLTKDGYIWGRGSVDMKGEAIAQLMTMLILKRAHVPLRRDIIFLATSDEEIGAGVGAAWIAEQQAPLVKDAEFLLNEGGLTRADGHGGVEFYGIGTTEKSPFWLDVPAAGAELAGDRKLDRDRDVPRDCGGGTRATSECARHHADAAGIHRQPLLPAHGDRELRLGAVPAHAGRFPRRAWQRRTGQHPSTALWSSLLLRRCRARRGEIGAT